jgi:hypothetical protein
MASGSRAATITRFFSPLSKEEVHEKIKKDSAAWQEEERNRVARNEATKAAKESARLVVKRPVGDQRGLGLRLSWCLQTWELRSRAMLLGQTMQAGLCTTVSRSTRRLKSSEEATPTGSFKTCGFILRRQ